MRTYKGYKIRTYKDHYKAVNETTGDEVEGRTLQEVEEIIDELLEEEE